MQENRNSKITHIDEYRKRTSRAKERIALTKSKEDTKILQNRREGTEAKKQKPNQADFMLICLVISLVFFGLVMIFSASYYQAIDKYSDMFYFLKKQGMWAIISIIAMYIIMKINYKWLKALSIIGYLSSVGLLGAVLAVGAVTKGAQRWLTLGGTNFQPSEFAKIAIILFLSYILSKKEEESLTSKEIWKYIGLLFLPCVLIFIENFSTAIVLFCIGIVMLLIRNFSTRLIIILTIFAAVCYMGIYLAVPSLNLTQYVPEKYKQRISRIEVWLDPWSDPKGGGFQTIQSLYAVGSGGIFGLGLGQSRQKLGYIPEAHNDIIFSIICEELGLVGATLLILAFITLIWKGIKIAVRAPDLYSSLVAAGITTMIALQVIINIAVITNTIPVTGMPLPFISYGGSSLLTLMISMGILLNISKFEKE